MSKGRGMHTSSQYARNRVRVHEPIRSPFENSEWIILSRRKNNYYVCPSKACNSILEPENDVTSGFLFGEFSSLRSFLSPRVPCATLAE